ncbi:FadR/GntR family transcriptional regulator [Roseibium limicola]|uniref:Pyruvate dehydrogenase complex repressor n=1 Tax=Roseibium limicola TaxID=2816037 RepID=A0A939ENR9_9HYPH|nr:FadR/GntR family transcriptional regulator [Roseibium limicola]MBO0345822.1 FadR family transcriptional regulator [Roseibium limicola]
MFEKIPSSRTADAVTQQIEKLILAGVLRPGDRLPAERELAAQLDVSRPVLRESLKTLESQDLLVSRPGGGTFVADVIGPIFSEPVVALIERHTDAADDYLEFRRDLESQSAAYAAERASDTDLAILDELISNMKTAYAHRDHAREAILDTEFHQAIGEAAHNVILMHCLRSCYRLLENGILVNQRFLFDMPGARETLLEQHERIAQAIANRAPDEAAQASRDHIDFVRQAVRETKALTSRQTLADLRRSGRQNSRDTALDTTGGKRRSS